MLGDNENNFHGRSKSENYIIGCKVLKRICRSTPGRRYKDGCDKEREVKLVQVGIGRKALDVGMRVTWSEAAEMDHQQWKGTLSESWRSVTGKTGPDDGGWAQTGCWVSLMCEGKTPYRLLNRAGAQ